MNKLAYSIENAADACDVGETTLKAAIERGDLVRRYPTSRPVLLATELQEWLESLPTEKPRRKAS